MSNWFNELKLLDVTPSTAAGSITAISDTESCSLLSKSGQTGSKAGSKESGESGVTNKGSVPQVLSRSRSGDINWGQSSVLWPSDKSIAMRQVHSHARKSASWVRFSMVHGQAEQTYCIAQARTKNKQLSISASPEERGVVPVESPHSSSSQQCDPGVQWCVSVLLLKAGSKTSGRSE